MSDNSIWFEVTLTGGRRCGHHHTTIIDAWECSEKLDPDSVKIIKIRNGVVIDATPEEWNALYEFLGLDLSEDDTPRFPRTAAAFEKARYVFGFVTGKRTRYNEPKLLNAIESAEKVPHDTDHSQEWIAHGKKISTLFPPSGFDKEVVCGPYTIKAFSRRGDIHISRDGVPVFWYIAP